MKNKKELISDIIYKELSYIYCDNCRYNNDEGYNICMNCNRKQMMWEISKKYADEIAEKIIRRANK